MHFISFPEKLSQWIGESGALRGIQPDHAAHTVSSYGPNLFHFSHFLGVVLPKKVVTYKLLSQALTSGERRLKQLVRKALVISLRMRFWRKTIASRTANVSTAGGITITEAFT